MSKDYLDKWEERVKKNTEIIEQQQSKTKNMSEKARSTEEIQIYFLLNKVRYTKEDIDLNQVMGEIIHIMENRKKIKDKSIYEAKKILTTIRKVKK